MEFGLGALKNSSPFPEAFPLSQRLLCQPKQRASCVLEGCEDPGQGTLTCFHTYLDCLVDHYTMHSARCHEPRTPIFIVRIKIKGHRELSYERTA